MNYTVLPVSPNTTKKNLGSLWGGIRERMTATKHGSPTVYPVPESGGVSQSPSETPMAPYLTQLVNWRAHNVESFAMPGYDSFDRMQHGGAPVVFSIDRGMRIL